MNEPVRRQSDGAPDGGSMLPPAPKRRTWAAVALVAAAVLFLAGIALGSSRGSDGRGALANLADAFRAAFGASVPRETIPLREETYLPMENTSSVASTASPPLDTCESNTDEEAAPGTVVLSEVAWMGSPANARHEWIELANVSGTPAGISGWHIYDRDRKLTFLFPDGTTLPPHAFLLLAREHTGPATPGAPSLAYRGSLNNTDESLELFDGNCNLVDAVRANPTWPAGDNATKRTMERDLATLVWHTSLAAGGTPGQSNSPGVPGEHAAASTAAKSTTPLVAPPPSASSSTRGHPPEAASVSPPSPPTPREPALCSQENLPAPTWSVLLSEVAWAGTAPTRTADEWIELQNPSGAPVPLTGWQIVNRSRTMRVLFSSSSIIVPHGYLLLERGEAAVPWVSADVLFSGALKNNDESLRLFDRDCRLIDEVIAEATWPAGTAAPDYRSAERSDNRSWHTYNWSPINGTYGTPRMVNSEPAPVPATPPSGGGGTPPPTTTSTVGTSSAAVLVSEVMAGSDGASANEFVELYNAGGAVADLTGWCMKKRTSTGSESTLVAASRLEGKSIVPGHYLLLGNDGGYQGSISPDVRWPASYTLAYTSNAVVVYRGCSEKVDEAAWSEIPAGQSIVRDGWGTTTFSPQAVPTPQNASSP